MKRFRMAWRLLATFLTLSDRDAAVALKAIRGVADNRPAKI